MLENCVDGSLLLVAPTNDEEPKSGCLINICILRIQAASSPVLLAEEPEINNEEEQQSPNMNCKTCSQKVQSFANLEVNVRLQFPPTKQRISGWAYLHMSGSHCSIDDSHNLERQGKQAHGDEEVVEVSGPDLHQLVVVYGHNLGQDAEDAYSNKRRADARAKEEHNKVADRLWFIV